MKCRIIDPRKREVVRQFFNREVFDLEEGDVLDMRLYSKLRGGLNRVPLLLEPVPEIVGGWHPFPADKPEKVGRYVVAYNCDGEREVDAAPWNGENFFPAGDDVVAWREFPKYW